MSWHKRWRIYAMKSRVGLLLMSSAATSSHERRSLGDLLPAAMLAVVVFASFVILVLLATVLWLAWTTGSPGIQALAYTPGNFVELFTDQRTYTLLIDTLGFASVSLGVALAFGIPASWNAYRTDVRPQTLLFTLI